MKKYICKCHEQPAVMVRQTNKPTVRVRKNSENQENATNEQ